MLNDSCRPLPNPLVENALFVGVVPSVGVGVVAGILDCICDNVGVAPPVVADVVVSILSFLHHVEILLG